MYRIYHTDPQLDEPCYHDTSELSWALQICEDLRKQGYTYVTMVSDYADMVGKPGAQGAGPEYVPQLKN